MTARMLLAEQAYVAQLARDKTGQIIENIRVTRTLEHTIPFASETKIEQGDKVLVQSEKAVDDHISEWGQPYDFVDIGYEKKLAYVRNIAVGPARQFNLTQIKRYFPLVDISYSFLVALAKKTRLLGSKNSGSILTEILGHNL